MYRITITADFDDADALADLEEAVGRLDGDLQVSEIDDLDDDYAIPGESPDPGWMLD